MEELLKYRRRMLQRYAEQKNDYRTLLRHLGGDLGNLRFRQSGKRLGKTLSHICEMDLILFIPAVECILLYDSPDLKECRRLQNGTHQPLADWPSELLIESWSQERQDLLARVDDLPPSGWCRSGRHPLWGTRTLQWWIERSLWHTDMHLHSIQYLGSGVSKTGHPAH